MRQRDLGAITQQAHTQAGNDLLKIVREHQIANKDRLRSNRLILLGDHQLTGCTETKAS